jgi:hypothetical protein
VASAAQGRWNREVVQRVGVESAQRVLVVGRGEDHEGHGVERGEQIEPRLSRHLHVEEQEVRLHLLERLASLRRVRGLADDLDFRVPAQEAAGSLRARRSSSTISALMVLVSPSVALLPPAKGPAATG